MENKFKVGDKVVVNGKLDKKFNNQYGRVVVVNSHDYGVEFYKHIDGHSCGRNGKDGYCWYVPPHFCTRADETIVIYRKDDKVYALDKVTGEKVSAKCHPDDEFDFKKGAEIAFNRLLGKEPEKPKELYNGKVICLDTGGYCFYTKGKIYPFKDGVLTTDFGDKVVGVQRSFDSFVKSSGAKWLEVVE